MVSFMSIFCLRIGLGIGLAVLFNFVPCLRRVRELVNMLLFSSYTVVVILIVDYYSAGEVARFGAG